jgi:hypothetical protein
MGFNIRSRRGDRQANMHPLARATIARESAGAPADFVAGVILIYALPIETYLVVGPVLSYGTIGALALWTILYRRYRTRNVPLAADAHASSER